MPETPDHPPNTPEALPPQVQVTLPGLGPVGLACLRWAVDTLEAPGPQSGGEPCYQQVLIGLDAWGGALAQDLPQALDDLSATALYAVLPAEGPAPAALPPLALEILLAGATTVVLAFSAATPGAFAAARQWAAQMGPQDVYLTAALVQVPPGTDPDALQADPQWQALAAALDTVIIQPEGPDDPPPAHPGVRPALLSAHAFQLQDGLICIDASDLRRVISGGRLVLATTATARPLRAGGDPGVATEALFAALGGRTVDGLWLTVIDGFWLELREYDRISTRLDEILPDEEIVCAIGACPRAELPCDGLPTLHALWRLVPPG